LNDSYTIDKEKALMKVKTLLLVVLSLVMAHFAMAACSITYGWQTNFQEQQTVLKAACPDQYPDAPILPDKSTTNPKQKVYIYHDYNNNGTVGAWPCEVAQNAAFWSTYVPGSAIGSDNLLTLCALCPTNNHSCNVPSTARTYNLNQFDVPGAGVAGTGKFVSPWPVAIQGAVDASHRQMFMVVYSETQEWGKCVWVSNLFLAATTTSDGARDPSDWYCIQIAPPVPSCVQSGNVTLDGRIHAPQNPVTPRQSVCATICPNAASPLVVCVGPLVSQDRIPTVSVLPGCHTPNCDDNCTAANGFVWNPTWVWTTLPEGNFYCAPITWGTGTLVGGCVCISLESILPVEISSHDVAGMDNAVKVSWATRSETNVDKFIVKRDGVVAGEVRAENSATGHSYSFTDEGAVNGTTYTYTLVIKSSTGAEDVAFSATATPSLMNAIVTEYALRQNYPNPFNPTTNIIYDVKNTNLVTLKVYNAAGQEVTTLVNGSREGGHRYSVTFDANNLPSGLYFYSIKVGNEFNATKKMLLVK